MAKKTWWMPTINEDVEAEFSFWKKHFVLSIWIAVGAALAVAFLIAVWPPGSGNAELRDFARQIWPLFVECAFWLGFLLGLMWAAAKRAGSALSGTLPWLPRRLLSARAAASRQFGQWAMFTALASCLLWISIQFRTPEQAGTAAFFSTLSLLMQTCLWFAAMFAIAAVAGRERLVLERPKIDSVPTRMED
ncbi:MAG TPA: hypothetical protein VFF81_00155 [Noviherbaspirillum sp.]|nr:hypothetical protein [Noviherbaspirillum sp.]